MTPSTRKDGQGVKPSQSPTTTRPFALVRLLPFGVILVALGLFFAFDLEQYVRFDTLRTHRLTLQAWVAQSSTLAALVFVAIYTLTTACSLPGATVLSITSGFLFGAVWGTVLIVVSATLGGTILFLLAKTALGDSLRSRASGWLRSLEAGFQANALSYLLVLRLVPLFPFFIVNLVPALLGVPLRTFVVGTFVGIIPGAFVYASVGVGLGSIFDAGGTLSLTGILTPQVLVALGGLAGLALIPVVYKAVRTPRGAADAG